MGKGISYDLRNGQAKLMPLLVFRIKGRGRLTGVQTDTILN